MTALATPTGVHLGLLEPGTPEWGAARGGLCVTATEIAAVMGLSPWMSRFSLWHRKAGLPTGPREANPAMRWGARFEDDVEEEFAERHPEFLIAQAGTWRHRERPWQRATPDRLLYSLTPDKEWRGAVDVAALPTELLEIKTSPFGDDWEDGLPVHYRAQTLWQLDTLGLRRARVALLVLSGLEYREYEVEHDAGEAALLRAEARRFLDSVEAGERPPIDSSTDTYRTVRAQTKGREDEEVEVPAELADRYEAAGAALKAAEEDRRLASAELLDLIGGNRWATVAGRRIAQRLVRDGETHSLTPCKQKASTP